MMIRRFHFAKRLLMRLTNFLYSIMFGPGFTTILTLVEVPVLYATLFGFHRSS